MISRDIGRDGMAFYDIYPTNEFLRSSTPITFPYFEIELPRYK